MRTFTDLAWDLALGVLLGTILGLAGVGLVAYLGSVQ